MVTVNDTVITLRHPTTGSSLVIINPKQAEQRLFTSIAALAGNGFV